MIILLHQVSIRVGRALVDVNSLSDIAEEDAVSVISERLLLR